MSKLIYPILFLIAFSVGFSSEDSDQIESIELMSTEESAKIFDTIPCPDTRKMEKLFKQINLVYKVEDLNCDDPLFGKLAKTLVYTESFKFSPPKSWPEGIKQDLTNLISYFSANSKSIEFDLNQVDSLAYNKFSEKKIFIGRRMFNESPLEALSVLFHEARHSVEGSDMHAYCLKGDTNNTVGACDAKFSLDHKTTGAYTYSVMFYLTTALYSSGLTEGQKEWGLINGLTLLSSRFNELPSSLAKFEDILAIVDDKMNIFLFDIEKSKLVPFRYRLPDNQRPIRIEFSVFTGGLLFFTDKGQMYTFSFYENADKLNPFLKKQVEESRLFPIFSNRVYVPRSGIDEGTLHLVYGKNRELYYNIYSPQANRSVFRPYWTKDRKGVPSLVPDIDIFFQALNVETVILEKTGRIYFAHKYGDEDPFLIKDAVKEPDWISGTGGVFSDGLYLINQDHKMRTFKVDLIEPESGDQSEAPERRVVEVRETFPTPGPILQYTQGFNYEAFLDEKSKVHIRSRLNPSSYLSAESLNTISNAKKIIMLRRVETKLVQKEN